MKKNSILLVCLLFLLLSAGLTAYPAAAQTESRVILGLNKVVGFKSFGDQQIRAQGTFDLTADVSDDIVRVEFYLDGSLMGEDDQQPFRLQFNTDAYSLGVHTLSAIGFTGDGQQVESNQLLVTFVTVAEAWKFGLRLLLPIILIAVIALGISLLGRRKIVSLPAGSPRTYGRAGGTICRRCGRPFALHILSVDLFGRKLERCPYCGAISLVGRRSVEELQAAERAELNTAEGATKIAAESDEEKLKRQVDAAKYTDGS